MVNLGNATNNEGLEEPTPEAILDALRTSTSPESYRRAIIDAEVADFDANATQELIPLLRRFTETHRNSNVPADLVAVGSAIRTLIAVASGDSALEFATSLLEAGGRLTIPIEIEVEISKMVVRKLTANPPARNDAYPRLATRLLELAETYLNPRLLGRPKHGAVALNAVLGIVLTRDRRSAEIIDRVHTMGIEWFQQLVTREATRLRAEIAHRADGEPFAELIRSLEELSEAAAPISST